MAIVTDANEGKGTLSRMGEEENKEALDLVVSLLCVSPPLVRASDRTMRMTC